MKFIRMVAVVLLACAVRFTAATSDAEEDESQNYDPIAPLITVAAVASAPVLIISAWVLLLISRSTAKQRERGGSHFARPLAMAASSVIFIGLTIFIRQAFRSEFSLAMLDVVFGLALVLGIQSLSSFSLAWLTAAALASNGIAATKHRWIRTFRTVVRIHGALPLLDYSFTVLEPFWNRVVLAGKPAVDLGWATTVSTVIMATNAFLLLAVTMPWLSCKLRGLAAAKESGYLTNMLERATGLDIDGDGDVGEAGNAAKDKARKAAPSEVVARLLNLSRVARNASAIAIAVSSGGVLYTVISAPSSIMEAISPIVGTTIMLALVLPLHDISWTLRRHLAKHAAQVHPTAIEVVELQKTPVVDFHLEGLPITVLGNDGAPCTVGMAPLAPLPSFLHIPHEAIRYRQADVDPTCWSLTIAQWLRFVRACFATPTWSALAKAKGGEEWISMYDVNTHFVIPWTRGSGCSIALLFHNSAADAGGGDSSGGGPPPVELMLSHAWAGSVIQVHRAIQSLLGFHALPDRCPCIDRAAKK